MGRHFQEAEVPAKSGRRFRKAIVIAAAACLAGTAAAGSFATVLAQDTPVISNVLDGSIRYELSSVSTDVDTLLREAGVSLGDQDMVVQEQTKDGNTITVKRRISADISVGDKTVTVQGYSGDTVGQLVEASGVEKTALDAVTPAETTKVFDDTKITIEQKKQVYIVDNHVARNYIVPAGSASQAVKSAGIELGEEDTVANGKQTVEDGSVIYVNRVTYAEYEETLPVEYTVTEEESDTLPVGETETKTEGEEGEKVVTYKQKLVNGEVRKTSKISEEVTKEATDKVVLVGTKEEEPEQEETEKEPETQQEKPAQEEQQEETEAEETAEDPAEEAETNRDPEEAEETEKKAAAASGNTFTDSDGQVVSYSNMLTGSGTAYSAAAGARTSTGEVAQVGIVAVNPSVIPYGTRLYIAAADGSYDYGYAVAGDTGGALMDGSALVDLFMDSDAECMSFGRRTVNVYILD